MNGNNDKTDKNQGNSNQNAGAYKVNDKVSIEENGKWYPGYILEVKGDQYKIHYDGYDPKYDTWVGTNRLKALGGSATVASANSTASSSGSGGQFKMGDMVEFVYGGETVTGEITSELSSAGRYSVKHGTNSTWMYPKELKATNLPNANIAREKEAEQKRKDDEAKAKKDAEDAVGVVEGEKLQQWYKDVEFANDAVGQLCYYLDNHPGNCPGFVPEDLPKTMKALEQLEKVMTAKYPNAKTRKELDRFSTQYTWQPGLYREVYEQRVALAKKALSVSIDQKLKDMAVWNFDKELKQLKDYESNSLEGAIMCKVFLEWAYFPDKLNIAKEQVKARYVNAYKSAGLEFKNEEVYAPIDNQLLEIKKTVDENIAQYTLAKKKAAMAYTDEEAKAVMLASFKREYPGATVISAGFTGDYITSTDDNYVPPKPLGKGKGGIVVAKVPGIPYLVSYYCAIEKNYVGGGKFGPTQVGANGFTFAGLVNNN
jgi:hypothetical protein